MAKQIRTLAVFIVILCLVLPVSALPKASAAGPIPFTILHTNDFHGQLQASGSNPGLARVAAFVNGVRTTLGTGNVLLVDAGDEMQGSLLSNLQKGAPTIAAFNATLYDVATFGNHEFDWGQTVLTDRTTQATYPFVSANIVVNNTGDCATAGWTSPAFTKPYEIKTVAGVKVGFIGVTTTETPTITIASATAGLCFKDPANSILHYYDELKAASDVLVVLSHLGLNDGGYGYGIPVYGDKTLAAKLNTASKPVNLIIGGHSHTNMLGLTPPGAVTVGNTVIGQAYYNGRQVGQANMTFDPATKAVTVAWKTNAISTTGAEDPTVKGVIDGYANDPPYQSLINQPIGYSAVDLSFDYNGDNMMGDFVDDAIYKFLNTDADATNDVDMFFNNAGGIRTAWCWNGSDWINTGCVAGIHDPALLTYGDMFTILPFGNATAVGTMTGAQIVQLLNQSATLFKGAIQPSGIRFKFYRYVDANPGPQPYARGAFDYEVYNKTTLAWEPLDMAKTYKVGTNEFLAPAGQDGYLPFKYMKNITYWGDMLNAVNAYVTATYTLANPYKGPDGDGTLDGRITRDGTDTPDSGSILPITILHNNDSHGNLVKGPYVAYTQLATLIKQEELHNPGRTLLLNGGDQIQGDAMMYYFKSSFTGFAADGTPLPDALKTQPEIAVMNSLGYDAMTLGNHEFNFGSAIFKGVMGQTTFPVLGANVSDDGQYGLAEANGGAGVQPYIEKDLGGIKVVIVGITNHRVPNYELPSNIPGLTFSNPLTTAQTEVDAVRASNDVVIALTHIGFTEDPKSVEVDKNVDTNLAAVTSGLDAIIGAHSHTNPSTGFGDYKFLPTIVGGPDNTPVIINQAYRYNNYLGEVVLGVRAKAGGGYEVVSRAGQYIAVTMDTPEDAATKAIVDPYAAALASYYNKVVGQTTVPIDTRQAFTQETNGANLQADASVWELAQKGITDVDVHLSGAMTNKLMADGATPEAPVTLKISDMFAGMPYENSLVVISMNGPQIKAVLERAYRNYYYYKYVPGYGGYSYYTTCMIDTNAIGRIFYRDTSPTLPDGNNVVALLIDGKPVDFTDAAKYYNVSTVNYLAAGSCNFNDGGVSLWPLSQIVHDTQFYVRDAVIDYITAMGIVSPKLEGRLLFGDTVAPVVTITSPEAKDYLHPELLTLDFSAVDGADGTTPSFAPPSGVKTITALLDTTAVTDGQVIDLLTLAAGSHTLTVTASDYYDNTTTASVTFNVVVSVQSLQATVNRFFNEGKIDNGGIRTSLLVKLVNAQALLDAGQTRAATNVLRAFINEVEAQTGKHITADAAAVLIADAREVIADLVVASSSRLSRSASYFAYGTPVTFIPIVKH